MGYDQPTKVLQAALRRFPGEAERFGFLEPGIALEIR
jgi:hypothetical protein